LSGEPKVELQPGERLDNLLTESNLYIIQSREVFSFSLDAVLLARFAKLPKQGKVLDLCTGNGVVALLISDKTQAKIDAVEIQPRLAELAGRNVKLNGLDQRITIIQSDLNDYAKLAGNGEYSAITINPPYMRAQAGGTNINEHYAIARHEIYCTIDDIARAGQRLLRPGGKLFMVHRPSRLSDIIESFRKWKLEVKIVQFVHPNRYGEANMVLIEAVRDGKPDIRVLPPQFVYNDEGVQVI